MTSSNRRMSDAACGGKCRPTTREVDLLIAGAGPAGMAAALIAALEGLDVLLCEKSDQVGGTGATSAGTLWIPGNSQSKAAGFHDSGEQADIYLSALVGEATNRELRTAYLQSGPAAIDYLCARTDVQFVPCATHPDYRSNMPGAAIAGRAIMPEPFDGRLLGSDFWRVRPPVPEFMLFRRHDGRQGRYPPAHRPLPLDLQFHLFRKTVRTLSRRSSEISARHTDHDGQRTRWPAITTVCANAKYQSCSIRRLSMWSATGAASPARISMSAAKKFW